MISSKLTELDEMDLQDLSFSMRFRTVRITTLYKGSAFAFLDCVYQRLDVRLLCFFIGRHKIDNAALP